MKIENLSRNLSRYWQNLKPRERRLIGIAGLLIGLALLWWLTLAPALKVLKQAPDQHRQLDAQIQAMQSMSNEAKSLQNQPKLGLDDAQKALQAAATQRFASAAQLSMSGNRASLILKNADAQALAEFLTQARVNARAVPSELKITRSATPSTGWDGSITFSLPAK